MASIGLSTNCHGGLYEHGKAYCPQTKYAVALVYKTELREAILAGKHRPSLSHIARQTKVSRDFVRKVEDEIQAYGDILHPSEVPKHVTIGPGSKSLSKKDEFVLISLRTKDPFRNTRSYKDCLQNITGTIVCEKTIDTFFKKAFHYKGSLVKTDKVPFDKFKPDNWVCYHEYIDIVKRVWPWRLKFADEKHLKAAEMYNRKARRDPITGEVPPMIVDCDFRNTYSITGICGIDKKATPVFAHIEKGTTDSTSFSMTIEEAIATGFLRRGDFLVFDNAAIHLQGENSDLEDWLWSSLGIIVLPLPTRAPELNPMELVWRNLCRHLQTFPLSDLRGENGSVDQIALDFLEDMTHAQIRSLYREAKYL